MPETPLTPEQEMRAALQDVRTIAVVGLSPKPERPSHHVGRYLLAQGFSVIPIRPGLGAVLGQPAYPSLSEYGKPVDLVNIFRRQEAVPGIVEEAIALKCKAVWMQEGIRHPEAAARARAAGLWVVEDQCLYRVLAGGA